MAYKFDIARAILVAVVFSNLSSYRHSSPRRTTSTDPSYTCVFQNSVDGEFLYTIGTFRSLSATLCSQSSCTSFHGSSSHGSSSEFTDDFGNYINVPSNIDQGSILIEAHFIDQLTGSSRFEKIVGDCRHKIFK